MKTITNSFFPLKLQLNILQLEEYKLVRFLNWASRNLLTRNVQTKKTLVYTTKVKNIIALYLLICLVSLFINVFLFLTLILEPFIGLALAVVFLKPYEFYNKQKTIQKTKGKIATFKKLKVIGITGSFGKTSTKEILYQILKTKYKVLRTPESFNTIFGIAKVVDLELDSSYEFFICEMAAYKKGEIKTLCKMVPPQYAILTGITTQHFERFGNLVNTVKAKFELVEAVKIKNNIVFNLQDKNILKELQARKFEFSENKIFARNIKFDKNGSSFGLLLNGKSHKVKTSLFGSANIKNVTLACNMALKLGLSEKEIVKAIETLEPFDNRNVLINKGSSTLVNNTYSSNIQSFREMINTARNLEGKKILITPGIVELGDLEQKVHEELGKKTRTVFDEVVLVGKNKRTNSFAKGLGKKYRFIDDTRNEYFATIEESAKIYSWIFLENDITQNY